MSGPKQACLIRDLLHNFFQRGLKQVYETFKNPSDGLI